MNCLTDSSDFRLRLQERLRNREKSVPMIERETTKQKGEAVISSTKVEWL